MLKNKIYFIRKCVGVAQLTHTAPVTSRALTGLASWATRYKYIS